MNETNNILPDERFVKIESRLDRSADQTQVQINLQGETKDCIFLTGAAVQNVAQRVTVPPEIDMSEAKQIDVVRAIAEIASCAMFIASTEEQRNEMQSCGLSPLAFHLPMIDPGLQMKGKRPAPDMDSPSMIASMYIDPDDNNVMTDMSFTGRYNDAADLISGFLGSVYQMLTEGAPESVSEFIREDLKRVAVAAIDNVEANTRPVPENVIPFDKNKMN